MGSLWVQGQVGLHSEQPGGYRRPCLKQNKMKQSNIQYTTRQTLFYRISETSSAVLNGISFFYYIHANRCNKVWHQIIVLDYSLLQDVVIFLRIRFYYLHLILSIYVQGCVYACEEQRVCLFVERCVYACRKQIICQSRSLVLPRVNQEIKLNLSVLAESAITYKDISLTAQASIFLKKAINVISIYPQSYLAIYLPT